LPLAGGLEWSSTKKNNCVRRGRIYFSPPKLWAVCVAELDNYRGGKRLNCDLVHSPLKNIPLQQFCQEHFLMMV